MKQILTTLFLFVNFLFAQININEASRYELMKFAELDAGRADMLIKHRQTREITSVKDLKTIIGFENYNTSKLEQTFEFKSVTKPQQAKTAPDKPIRIIEKTRVVRYASKCKKIIKLGDMEILEDIPCPKNDYEYPKKEDKNDKKKEFKIDSSKYEAIDKNNGRYKYNSYHKNNDNIDVNGYMQFKINK